MGLIENGVLYFETSMYGRITLDTHLQRLGRTGSHAWFLVKVSDIERYVLYCRWRVDCTVQCR